MAYTQGIALFGPLSFEILEEGYQHGSYGLHEPQQMRASPATIVRMREYLKPPTMFTHFNAARLEPDPAMPDDYVLFTGGGKQFTDPTKSADVLIVLRTGDDHG